MVNPSTYLRSQKKRAVEARAAAPSRAKAVKGSRFILQDRELTKRSARGQVTRGKTKGAFAPSPHHKGGDALKTGVMRMGERLNLDPERLEKLSKMEPERLQSLYDQSDLLFDVFFSYEGIHDSGDYFSIDPQKLDDVDFFIEQYERAYGAL